jgi:hypothetical protein
VVTLIWQESPNVQIVTYESLRLAVSREAEAFRKGWLGSKAMQPLPKLP